MKCGLTIEKEQIVLGFAPAFTLSLCDSEYARKPPIGIASEVSCMAKK